MPTSYPDWVYTKVQVAQFEKRVREEKKQKQESCARHALEAARRFQEKARRLELVRDFVLVSAKGTTLFLLDTNGVFHHSVMVHNGQYEESPGRDTDFPSYNPVFVSRLNPADDDETLLDVIVKYGLTAEFFAKKGSLLDVII